MTVAGPPTAPEALRRDKAAFDNTWTLTTILATTLVVLSWYFGLAQVDIGPVIWTLAALAFAHTALALPTRRAASPAQQQWLAFGTQLAGTALLGAAWHLFGGLQQPLFPLLIILPLLPGALLLGFWQQQVALLALIAVLVSGVLLSPDGNSFIAERYGISPAAFALPAWVPRSRVVFTDVATSPGYDLMLVTSVVTLGIAVSIVGRRLAGLFGRDTQHVSSLEEQLTRLQELNAQLVTRSPSAEVLVESVSGRIVRASARFQRAFGLEDTTDKFLLDAATFDYPTVIRNLIQCGGEEIQGATLKGREVVLRIRAEVLQFGTALLTALELEEFPEVCLRGAFDALEEPTFAVTSGGQVVLLNRSAASLLGPGAGSLTASGIFDAASGRWWDIAPLDSARRILSRGAQRYLVSIRRQRVVASVNELAFVNLKPVAQV